MKRLLLLIIIVASFLACKKESSPSPPTVSYAWYYAFRPPTCGDTTDDFVFEHYNDSETAYLLTPAAINTEVKDTSFVRRVGLYKRDIDLLHGLYMYYENKKDVMLSVVSHIDSAHGYSWQYHYEKPNTYSVDLSRFLYDTTRVAGCYRFYYAFYEPDTANRNLTRSIVDKGHFDLYLPKWQ